MSDFAAAISAAYGTSGPALDMGRGVHEGTVVPAAVVQFPLSMMNRHVPTPVVHSRMVAPASRMAPADDVEAAAKASPLYAKYGTRVDAESAREKLAARVESAAAPDDAKAAPAKAEQKEAAKAAGGGAGAIGKFLKSREGKAVQKQVVRGVFGMLKKRF